MYVCQTKLFTERVDSKRQKLYLKKMISSNSATVKFVKCRVHSCYTKKKVKRKKSKNIVNIFK